VRHFEAHSPSALQRFDKLCLLPTYFLQMSRSTRVKKTRFGFGSRWNNRIPQRQCLSHTSEILTSDIYLCTFISLFRTPLSRVCVAPRALVPYQSCFTSKVPQLIANFFVLSSTAESHTGCVRFVVRVRCWLLLCFPLEKKAGNGVEEHKEEDHKVMADSNMIDLP
jgi:hypothetical protein